MESQEVRVRPFIYAIILMAFVTFTVSWGIREYYNPDKEPVPVTFITLTTASRPSSKRVLPEQRRLFAQEFGKKFKARYPGAIITTTGQFQTSLFMKSKKINEQFALHMKDNTEAINDICELGFKRLIMYDGKTAWVINLKN